jgi:hypothetical protein
MSEFSESYHLETYDQQAGVALMRRAGLHGFVFPETNGWVTLVPSSGEYGEPNDALIEASPGILIHYVNAEDQGWMLALYSNGVPVSGYSCMWLDESTWSDEVQVSDEELDLDLLVRICQRHGADTHVARGELQRLLHPDGQEWLMDFFKQNDMENPGHAVARLLGLEHYSWVASGYLGNENVAPGTVRV